MATLKVHLLNFHGPFTHIEVLVEDESKTPHTYYAINRWAEPWDAFLADEGDALRFASSVYSFNIDAEPQEIVNQWRAHHRETRSSASILGHNCGVSAQWFLTKFAGVPAPHFYSTPISVNHVIFGLFIPSFLPFPVTLPGRIMSNAKFHIEARKHPEKAMKYTQLHLDTQLALSATLMFAGIVGLVLASSLLSAGIGAALIITACVVVGAIGSYGFFTTLNKQAEKDIAMKVGKEEEHVPLNANYASVG
jgi:hypothetical protein